MTICVCTGTLCAAFKEWAMRIEKSYAYAPNHRINRNDRTEGKELQYSGHKYHHTTAFWLLFSICEQFTERTLDCLVIVLMYNCTCVTHTHARAHIVTSSIQTDNRTTKKKHKNDHTRMNSKSCTNTGIHNKPPRKKRERKQSVSTK